MKNLFLLLFLVFGTSLFAQKSSGDFVFTVNTIHPGLTNNRSFLLPIDTNYTYNYDIDWNDDGVFDSLGLNDSIIIQYPSSGSYSIRIRGVFPSIYFGGSSNLSTDRNKLLSIDQWGDQTWLQLERAFLNCDSLFSLPLDTPDISNVSSLSFMFASADNFDGVVDHWDVSSINDFSYMFYRTKFNKPINNWDVSNATNMRDMFSEISVFNQALNNWDVSSVTDMQFMVAFTAFNQPLNNWDVSNVTNMRGMFWGAINFNQPLNNWDVSNVTDMISMFNSAISFNQDISNWNVGNVLSMFQMFRNAFAFNQPLGNWDVSSTYMASFLRDAISFDQNLGNWTFSNVTNSTSYNRMLDGTNLSIQNYDSTLIGWAANNTGQRAVNTAIGVDSLEYCLGQSARTQLSQRGWILFGDILNCQTVGLEETSSQEFNIYPNPASTVLQFENAPMGEFLQIFNLQGQLIEEEIISRSTFTKDVSAFENGIYLIRIGEAIEKLVIQK